MNSFYSIASLLVLTGIAIAYKSGAPPEVCENMTPEHGVPPKTSASPYTLTTDHSSIKSGGKLIVKITGNSSNKFKGFLIQARNGADKIVNGVFGNVTGAKVFNCPPGVRNAVTHVNPEEKISISIPWTAPQNYKGSINFAATVVKDGGVFWVKQKSPKITIQ